MNITSLLNNVLIFDIETSSFYNSGKEVNISSDFDTYVLLAKVKWFGAYSYRHKKTYYINALEDRQQIIELLKEHSVLVGFNNKAFDFPVLVNNNLVDRKKKYNHIDCMTILGTSNFKDKDGYAYKDRGNLMDFKFKRNSLKCMAETMKLEFQKGEIDYSIFHKDKWTEDEKKEIIFYIKDDIMVTKGFFDKLWDYWMPFTDLIDWKFVTNFSWITSSIASMIYKSVCFCIGTEPTYSEHASKKEEKGGRVIEPKYEEGENIWYVDFASLYPHIMTMFNLFAEVDEKEENAWHGNELFEVKGYYDISYHHKLAKVVKEKLKQRIDLKAKDKDHPMVYTLKIWLNALYGIVRSALFEKVHTPNAGWDTCWLGQQIHKFTESELAKYGYETVGGDTDSLFLRGSKKHHNDRDYMRTCLKQIIKKILAKVPFPTDTFDIDIEEFIPYILFPFKMQELVEEKERKLLKKKMINGYKEEEIDGKICIIREEDNKLVKKGRSWVKEYKGRKKNYLYLYEDKGKLKIKLVGLPIKKDGATALGIKIYNDVLESKILSEKRAKFPKEYIDGLIKEYLKSKEIMTLISREFKIKPYDSYKIPKGKTEPSCIYAQISKGYFDGGEGVINLIKNNKIGNAGKSTLYCTIEEALKAGLTVEDLDLEKLHNELEPFVIYVEPPPKPKKEKKAKKTKKKSVKKSE